MRIPGPMLIAAVLMAAACGDDVSAPQAAVTVAERSAGVAFTSLRRQDRGFPAIYLAGRPGSAVRRLTHGRSPALSWDGSRVAFYRDANPHDRRGIYVMAVDGTGERYIGAGTNPAWSRDGRLAWAAGATIVVADGSGLRRVVLPAWVARAAPACDDPWMTPTVDFPAWSPAGALAFTAYSCGVAAGLYVKETMDAEPRLLLPETGGPVAWSPDGTHLATVAYGMITIIHAATGSSTAYDLSGVYPSGRVDWLADSGALAFDAVVDGRQRIFRLDLATGPGVEQLIPDAPAEHQADFDVTLSRAPSS